MKVFIVLALALAAVSAETIQQVNPVFPETIEQFEPVSAEAIEQVYPKDLPNDKKIQGRITNGYNAGVGQAPYTVGLLFNNGNNGYWWCGGSIIANSWVLTAAHCTNGAGSVTIHYGGTWRTQAQFTHWVGSGDFIQHHLWPNQNGNDISLIRTPHVDFWSMVNSIALPSFNDRYSTFEGWWAVACGWGGTYDGSPLPDWLQCVDLQVMSNNQCSQTYGHQPEGILCVNTPNGMSTCQGDSGGPLVLHGANRLVGVTSWVAAAGCKSGLPSGFTRVTAHLEWIRANSGVAYY